MCGIAGIVSTNSNLIDKGLLKEMADSLRHRGPDGEGYWQNVTNNVGFAHRRLSILDLSDAAAQPMHYMQRYTMLYNGEIYNYKELKKYLVQFGYSFVSTGDTEVVLAAYDYFGEDCLQHFDGMFALAIWDEKTQTIFCARDRFGEKPFYYFMDDEHFIFASEMKALWTIGISKSIDYKMVLNYISIGHVQNPTDKSQTFYKDIYSLPPSYFIRYNLSTKDFREIQYHKINKNKLSEIKEADASYALDSLLSKSIQRRMRSDVPIGISLSGGLDSSTIAYYLSANNKMANLDLASFSAIFPGFEKSEEKYINIVTEQFDIPNYNVIPSASDLIENFEKLVYHQEEPFPSSSIFAQYKVYSLAKQRNISVLLDGQGADELLAGYHKYIHWYLQELFVNYKYKSLKKEIDDLKANDVAFKFGIKNMLASNFPSHASMHLERIEYRKTMHNKNVTAELISHVEGTHWQGIHKPIVNSLNDILHFNFTEMGLEELLRYADRSSMANSIEVRLPFLNNELVKFIFSLPSNLKINKGYTKYILRRTMNGKLPNDIVWRKDKIGFETPQQSWMESKEMKAYLHDAKTYLIKENILKASVLKQEEIPVSMLHANNEAWRYICMAEILKTCSQKISRTSIIK